MATMRGNAGGYGMGAPSYGGGSMNEPAQEGGALDAIRQHTSKIEDMLDTVAEPVKPYVGVPTPWGKQKWLADGLTVTFPRSADSLSS